MQKLKPKEFLIDGITIIFGTTIMALAITVFLDPLELNTGGVVGIAIILKSITGHLWVGGIPLWLTNIVINVPLFLVALALKGNYFGGKTLFATFYLSFALFYTDYLPSLTGDMLLGSIFGGVLLGIGLGFVLKSFATTGGTDLAAGLIHHYIQHISVGRILLFIDGTIVLTGFFFFGAENVMYALISIFIVSKLLDAILEGFKVSKGAFIISDHFGEIGQALMNDLSRGATGIESRGIFTDRRREMLFCVVSSKEIVRLKKIVKDIDPDSFVVVTDVREVLGEGFVEGPVI